MDKKIAFIGFGEIAKAITEGFLKTAAVAKENIYASALHLDKLQKNCQKYGINPATTKDIIENADIIFLAIKPHNFKEIQDQLIHLKRDQFIISLMAGYTSQDFASLLPDIKIITAIPNCCVAVAKGIFVADSGNNLDDEQMRSFNDLLSPIAQIYYLAPDTLSIASTIAGCTPAYSAMFIEAMSEAAVKYGLNREEAYHIIARMLIGTATMIEEGYHPGALKDLVSSPKGTTIKGIIKLEENGFRNCIIEAIEATQK